VATPVSSDSAPDVRPGLAIRLLAPQGLAQAAHLVAVGALLVLLWDIVPVRWLLAWAALVTLTIVLRASVTFWAARHRPEFERLRRQVRQTVGLTGMAWGLGAAALGSPESDLKPAEFPPGPPPTYLQGDRPLFPRR